MLIATIDKTLRRCVNVFHLDFLPEQDENTRYCQVDSYNYFNRKYDVDAEDWLDEYYQDDPGEQSTPITIESLQKEIHELKEQQKKDNLLMIKSLLEATEEIISATVPEEGGTP